jgi:hypothetical protein
VDISGQWTACSKQYLLRQHSYFRNALVHRGTPCRMQEEYSLQSQTLNAVAAPQQCMEAQAD